MATRRQTKRKPTMTAERFSVIVRMSVLGWSASLLTASYLGIIRDLDATFIAGLLTSTLGSFGLTVVGKNHNDTPSQPPSTTPSRKTSNGP